MRLLLEQTKTERKCRLSMPSFINESLSYVADWCIYRIRIRKGWLGIHSDIKSISI